MLLKLDNRVEAIKELITLMRDDERIRIERSRLTCSKSRSLRRISIKHSVG